MNEVGFESAEEDSDRDETGGEAFIDGEVWAMKRIHFPPDNQTPASDDVAITFKIERAATKAARAPITTGEN